MSSDLWKKARLGDIADVVMGQSPKSEYYNNTGQGLPFLQGNRTFGYKHPLFDTYCTNGNKFANPDDVLLSVRAPVGDLNITKERVCIGRGLASLCMKNGNNEYLYYLLKANIDELIKRESGTVYGSINRNDIIDFEVLVVDSDEKQLEVSDILSTLDDKIELNRQTNATLEAIAQAIFKEWFVDFNYPGATGELVESELGPIPKGWRVVQLGDITDLSWGDTKTTKDSYVIEGYMAYSASGPDGFLPYYDYSRDGIVVSAIGAYSGKTWYAHGEWSCIKNTIRFWSVDNAISNEYLFLLTSSREFWPLRGSAQPFISQTDARNKKVLYPKDLLANQFGSLLRPLFLTIHHNLLENIILTKVRDLLLPELLDGAIDL